MDLLEIEKAIVKITSIVEEEDKLGSGFLVKENLIITARHVIEENINNSNKISIVIEGYTGDIKVAKIIDGGEDSDVALLEINTCISDRKFLEFVFFKLNYNTLCNPELKYNCLGYLNSNPSEISSFWCFINTIENNNSWDFNLSIIQNTHPYLNLQGMSGSPLLFRDKVFGIAVEQVDNHRGIPLGVISTNRLKEFLNSNGVRPCIYHDYKMFEEEDIKDKLLNEIVNEIKSKTIMNYDTKNIILKGTEIVIGELKKLNANDFIAFIESVRISFDSKFQLDGNYKQYIIPFSEIVIQIVLMYYAFRSDIRFTHDIGASLKIGESKYVTYLFSDRYDQYMNIVMQFVRYIIDNPAAKQDNFYGILIGSESYYCKDRCNGNYSGIEIDVSGIIDEITMPDFSDDEREDILVIKERLSEFMYHCKSCLDYSGRRSPIEIRDRINNVLGGK